jgi:MFS family permease
MVSPAALSLLTTTYSEGPERNRALGIWQAATAGGATAGILAGGLLTQLVGWRAIFLVNPPLITLMLGAIQRVVPAGAAAGGQRLDVRGAALATSSLASLIFGVSHGQQDGFTSTATLIALAISVVLAIGFVITERIITSPMLPLSIFASATRRAGVAAMLLTGAIVAAYVYFISLFLQRVKHFTPIETGLALVPSTATVVLTSTVVSRRALARFGIKPVLILGLSSIAVGQLWLSRIAPGTGYALAVLPGLVLTAFGVGLTFPAASVAITSGVDRRDQGLAGGLFVSAQQTGSAVGLAALAAIAASHTAHTPDLPTAGYRLSFLLATGLALLALALVAVQIPRKDPHEELARQPLESGSERGRGRACVARERSQSQEPVERPPRARRLLAEPCERPDVLTAQAARPNPANQKERP